MFKFVITLIVTSFMVTVYAADTYPKDRFRTAQEAWSALAELGLTIEALPIVFFLSDQGTEKEKLHFPDDIFQVTVEDRKMVNGTTFSLRGPNLGMQTFFCPTQHPENSQKTCLAPRHFQPLERLKCAQEPTPEVLEDSDDETRKCGFADAGIHHLVGFSICPPDVEMPYHYKKNFLAIYEFCYDKEIPKILFTSHLIVAPKLSLDTNLLCREQELSFPYHRDETYPTIYYDKLYWETHWLLVSQNPKYVVQNLVPNEDMPFGIWKKTINQNFNFELLHNDLFNIWEQINKKVRKAANEEAKKSNGVVFYIRTAVIENTVGVPLYGAQQIYNRWFKMVIAKSERNEAISGVVIVMNNFISSQFDFSPDQLQKLNDEMEAFCSGTYCWKIFIKQVEASGSWVKCCAVTQKIAKLLGYESIPGLLKINGLTVLKNQT